MFNAVVRFLFNPTYLCKKCIDMNNTYYLQDLVKIKGGWNKRHYHKVKVTKGSFKGVEFYPLTIEEQYEELKRKEMNKVSLGSVVKSAAKAAASDVGKWYWHIHHEILAEQLSEPVENRVRAISMKGDAPETRQHFMRPVQNPPASASKQTEAVKKAQAVFNAISRAYNNGDAERDAYNRAQSALDNAKGGAVGASKAEWEALHKKECYHYCPWNGKTLIPIVAQGKR